MLDDPLATERLICPVGESHCTVIDRVQQLMRQVDELEALVRTDALTGLFNMRHFSEALDNEMERTRRSYQPTALVMMDLDHFKQVNDTRGHEVGNLALIQTAQQIRAHLRKLDLGCRYGGEEFALILPNTRLEKAVEVAERMRQLREEEGIRLPDGSSFPVTASFGVSVFTGTEFCTREEFVAHADRYLYMAKQSGRNCVKAPQQSARAATEVSADEKRLLFG